MPRGAEDTAAVAPGQEVHEDEVFQVVARRLLLAREVEREPGVAPVELRCLDQSLRTGETSRACFNVSAARRWS